MNKIRDILQVLFQSNPQNMTIPRYFEYLNEAGKLNGDRKSIVELPAVVFTILEEQEKELEAFRENFKSIEDILAKLVDKKVGTPTETKIPEEFSRILENKQTEKPYIEPEDILPTQSPLPEFTCPTCQKVCASKLGLLAHERSHK